MDMHDNESIHYTEEGLASFKTEKPVFFNSLKHDKLSSKKACIIELSIAELAPESDWLHKMQFTLKSNK